MAADHRIIHRSIDGSLYIHVVSVIIPIQGCVGHSPMRRRQLRTKRKITRTQKLYGNRAHSDSPACKNYFFVII